MFKKVKAYICKKGKYLHSVWKIADKKTVNTANAEPKHQYDEIVYHIHDIHYF